MSNKEQVFTLTLNLAEVNAVLQALGRQPYDAVASLVDSIRAQAQAQLSSSGTESSESQS
jgi:hypothetical protein